MTSDNYWWVEEAGGIEMGADGDTFEDREIRAIEKRSQKSLISRLDRRAKRSPWLHVGIAGLGGLALGLALGRAVAESVANIESFSDRDFDKT